MKHGKFVLPKGHKPFMKVAKGGSNCGNCKFLTSDKKHCGNSHFVTWYGTSLLPTPVSRYCSDWYEPNPEYLESGGYVPSPLVGTVVPPMNPERFEKKRAHLETLANSIRSLRMNVTKDLKSDDEKTRLTALAVAMIDKTAERVGNEDSAEKGHFGITVLRKRHVTISGNTVQLNYKGKSGVIHEKSFSDELVASSLRSAIKTSPKRSIFVTSDGFRIKADRVNRYLSDYNISAKDLRGYHANKYIVDKLSKQDIPSDVKKRKVLFRKAVRYSAARVGHKPMTLQKHYLMPELETYYIYEGEIINLSDFYSKGGSITSGEIKGPSHKDGGVPMVVAPTFIPIEVEGKEYYLCQSALSDPTVHSFVDKTNKEILDSIFVSHGCKYDKVIANAKDFIVCKLATQDKEKRTVSGTVSELINSMQSEYGCKVTSDSDMMLFGGEIGAKKTGAKYTFIDKMNNINFEIDDSNSHIIVNKIPDFDGPFVRLSTIFDHKELYEIYPELKEIKVWFITKSKTDEKDNPNPILFTGNYSAEKPKDPLFYTIKIATDHDLRSVQSPTSKSDIDFLRRGIIAELQHFIQLYEWGRTEVGRKGHRERIQRDVLGSRLRAELLDKSDPKRIAIENRNNSILLNIDYLVEQAYRSDYYEIHSRAAARRVDLTPDQRRVIPPIDILPLDMFDIHEPEGMESGGEVSSDCGCQHSYMELGGEISDSEKEKAKELLNSLTEEQLSLIASQYKEIVGEFIISQEKELDALVAERESLVSKKKEQDALKEYSKAMEFAGLIPDIDLKIRNKKNIILASKNGGDIISFTDKKGVLHSDIPNFSKINSSFISFDEETILTDPLPVYIPIIDEEIFASKGYIFDAIRVGPDIYILAVNGYREFKRSRSYAEESKPVPAEDFEQGYVTVTLDQLALINDYYYTKAKAVEYKRANESNKRVEATYDALPLERKLGYYNQRNFYNGLPAAVKKKVSLVEWEAFTLEQKESYYKPIQRRQGRRLVSKLEENEMWTSFHEMYERFINPLALPHDKKGVPIQPGSSRFGIYGHPEVFAYWRAFRYMMNWKIKDLKVQRQFESDLRAIAIETSFGESNTDPVLREKYGILVKRQNGDKINPAEIEQIRIAWSNVNKLFGGLVKSALDSNLKISHTGTKLVFSSKAAGMYIPKMGTIAVSNKFGDAQFESILAHETAHWIDNILGIASGKRWYSDDFENSAGIIADTLRRYMNEVSDSDYINSTKECFARAMEQYFAIETFGVDASIIYSYTELDRKRPYFAESHYVSESVYNEKLRPLIINFITENKTFFKYNIMETETKKEVLTNEEIAENLMGIDASVWDKLSIPSGEDLYADKAKQAEYISMLKIAIPFELFDYEVHDILEDNNAHALNQFLTVGGYYGEQKQKDLLTYLGKRDESQRIYFLDPTLFGLSLIEPVVEVDEEKDTLATVNSIEESVSKSDKTDRYQIYQNDSKMGEYQNIVEKNPEYYTRYVEFVKKELSPKYFFAYYSLGAPDSIKFHENILAKGLNIWNLIPEEFKAPVKVKPVEFKTAPDNKGLSNIHSEFTGYDDLRPILMHTHFDEDGVTSTDANRLIFTHKRGAYKPGDYCLSKDCFELKEEHVDDKKYPNYKAVIPKISTMDTIRIDANAILLYINTLKKVRLYNNGDQMVVSANDTNIGINYVFFSDGIKAMIKMGHTDITMAYSAPTRAIVLFPTMDKSLVNKFETDFVLIMPYVLYDPIIFPIYDLGTNTITNQGVDERLTDYETVQKFKKEIKKIKEKSITAEEIKKEISKQNIIETIEGLKILAETKTGVDKVNIDNTIAGLEVLLENMPDVLKKGGYALYKNGSKIDEVYY